VKVPFEGPLDSPIWIVGEAPGAEEELQGRPFVGASGRELTNMLNQAGIARTSCRVLNVFKTRPPDNDISHFVAKRKRAPWPDAVQFQGRWVRADQFPDVEDLLTEVRTHRPKVVLALGDIALWALTGRSGIGTWRGSILPFGEGTYVIPTYHPAAILRQWSDRKDVIVDMKRALWLATGERQPPAWSTHVDPSFDEALEFIEECKHRSMVSLDLETGSGQILCIGLAFGHEAMSIPLVQDGVSRWSEGEELQLLLSLRDLCSSGRVVGHNLLYDAFWLAWLFAIWLTPKLDTMLAHHLCFPGTKKSLAYCASLYCDWYTFWKHERYGGEDEWKDWPTALLDQRALRRYNCLDCLYTLQVAEALYRIVDARQLHQQLSIQMGLFAPVLKMELRGLPVDVEERRRMSMAAVKAIKDRLAYLRELFGHDVDPWATRQGGQLHKLFAEDFGLRLPLDKKTRKPSVGDEALDELAREEPLLAPAIRAIREARSVRSMLSGLLQAPGPQDRLYCSFNPAGTATFRFSSSRNPLGWGTNLQNIPKPGAKGKASIPDEVGSPRALIVPDPGYVLIEADLERADLYVVVWEADDEVLKHLIRHEDIHAANAKVIGTNRDFAKQFVHMVNYGAKPRTVAKTLRISVAWATQCRNRWFAEHPKILQWHERIEREIREKRRVRNQFGYELIIFDRPEDALTEALAWIPQSTVAICTNLGLLNIERDPEARRLDIQPLAHWHDALLLQAPEAHLKEALEVVKRCMSVVVPYPDPLVIPVDVKYGLRQSEMKK